MAEPGQCGDVRPASPAGAAQPAAGSRGGQPGQLPPGLARALQGVRLAPRRTRGGLQSSRAGGATDNIGGVAQITNHFLAPPLVWWAWPPMLPYSARRPRYTGPGPRAAAVWWRATPPSPLSGRASLPSVSGSAPPTSQTHLALFYYHKTFPTDDIKILDTFCFKSLMYLVINCIAQPEPKHGCDLLSSTISPQHFIFTKQRTSIPRSRPGHHGGGHLFSLSRPSPASN